VNLPKNAIDLYESLRAQVLEGADRQQRLCVIIYHGILLGLQLLVTQPNKPISLHNKQKIHPEDRSLDTNLIRLLANIVLCSQSEVMHVY
jgi:hypothetical protein